MTCGNYIQRLIDGDNSAMDDIYHSFRGGFLSFAHSSLGLKWDDASDLFQDAVICLMQNVQRGKLTALENHKVGAYLYTAGNISEITGSERPICHLLCGTARATAQK